MFGAVNLQEAVGRKNRQLLDAGCVILDRQHEPTALYDTRLAHHHELLGREGWVVDNDDAFGGFAGKPCGQTVKRTGEAIAPECIGQIGKLRSFRHDDAVQAHGGGAEQDLDDSGRELDQACSEVEPVIIDRSKKHVQLGAALFFEERGEKGRLAIEVVVERSLGNAGCPRDLGHGRPFISRRQKDGASTSQNLVALGTNGARGGAVFVSGSTRKAIVLDAAHAGQGSFCHSSVILNMLTELVGHRKIISVSGAYL